MLHINYDVNNDADKEGIYLIGEALSSPIRVAILSQLDNNGKSVTELAKLNYVSVSSIMFHLELLQKAGLVNVTTIENKKRKTRYASRACATLSLRMIPNNISNDESKIYAESQPVGGYIDSLFGDKSGIVTTQQAFNIYKNEPFRPERFAAQLIYTNCGYVEYAFNNSQIINHNIQEIRFSLEICSETSYFNNDFKSDITFSINGIELLTYTSPGDFGGRKGLLTPSFWGMDATQYGQLVTIIVNNNGVYLNGVMIKSILHVQDLKLTDGNCIHFRVESKKNARNRGGFNIFGKHFGDYPQDIEMTIRYE